MCAMKGVLVSLPNPSPLFCVSSLQGDFVVSTGTVTVGLGGSCAATSWALAALSPHTGTHAELCQAGQRAAQG